MIIRNDDPAFDTDLENYKTFCEICDKYGFQIIQAIVPIGKVQEIKREWSDSDIFRYSGFNMLFDNEDVYPYMLSRVKDIYAVHGLFHFHEPSINQIITAKAMMIEWGLDPIYFVTPFNEGDEVYLHQVNFQTDLKVSAKTDCLESFLPGYKYQFDIPKTEIVYLHSWRFGHKLNERPGVCYTYDQLVDCLERLKEVL